MALGTILFPARLLPSCGTLGKSVVYYVSQWPHKSMRRTNHRTSTVTLSSSSIGPDLLVFLTPGFYSACPTHAQGRHLFLPLGQSPARAGSPLPVLFAQEGRFTTSSQHQGARPEPQAAEVRHLGVMRQNSLGLGCEDKAELNSDGSQEGVCQGLPQ